MNMKVSDSLWRQPKWRLLVFRRAMAQVSAALVLCALAAGLYRSQIYFTFACCAAGTMLLAGAWMGYCRWRDGIPPKRPANVPYMLRRDKIRHGRRPAFLMNSEDFDDDLTPCTSVAEEDFSETACLLARMMARVVAGLFMIAVSLLV